MSWNNTNNQVVFSNDSKLSKQETEFNEYFDRRCHDISDLLQTELLSSIESLLTLSQCPLTTPIQYHPHHVKNLDNFRHSFDEKAKALADLIVKYRDSLVKSSRLIQDSSQLPLSLDDFQRQSIQKYKNDPSISKVVSQTIQALQEIVFQTKELSNMRSVIQTQTSDVMEKEMRIDSSMLMKCMTNLILRLSTFLEERKSDEQKLHRRHAQFKEDERKLRSQFYKGLHDFVNDELKLTINLLTIYEHILEQDAKAILPDVEWEDQKEKFEKLTRGLSIWQTMINAQAEMSIACPFVSTSMKEYDKWFITCQKRFLDLLNQMNIPLSSTSNLINTQSSSRFSDIQKNIIQSQYSNNDRFVQGRGANIGDYEDNDQKYFEDAVKTSQMAKQYASVEDKMLTASPRGFSSDNKIDKNEPITATVIDPRIKNFLNNDFEQNMTERIQSAQGYHQEVMQNHEMVQREIHSINHEIERGMKDAKFINQYKNYGKALDETIRSFEERNRATQFFKQQADLEQQKSNYIRQQDALIQEMNKLQPVLQKSSKLSTSLQEIQSVANENVKAQAVWNEFVDREFALCTMLDQTQTEYTKEILNYRHQTREMILILINNCHDDLKLLLSKGNNVVLDNLTTIRQNLKNQENQCSEIIGNVVKYLNNSLASPNMKQFADDVESVVGILVQYLKDRGNSEWFMFAIQSSDQLILFVETIRATIQQLIDDPDQQLLMNYLRLLDQFCVTEYARGIDIPTAIPIDNSERGFIQLIKYPKSTNPINSLTTSSELGSKEVEHVSFQSASRLPKLLQTRNRDVVDYLQDYKSTMSSIQ